MSLRAELISTGAELLSGRTLNRHGQVLGRVLASRGIRLERDTTVEDDLEVIADCVRQAVERCDVLFVTGGLGPTTDDVTREGVGEALGLAVVEDAGAVALLEQKYGALGRTVSEASRRQARVVEGARVWENPVGMAAGELIEREGCSVVLLPGPPREFVALLQTAVEPWLDSLASGEAVLVEKVFIVVGMGESEIADVMEGAGFPNAYVDVAYYTGPGQVELVLRSVDAEGLEQLAVQVRGWFAGCILAEERVVMEQVVVELLGELGKRVAVAESCTGGLLGARLTQVPGSSAVFRGGVVAYANAVKREVLGVPQVLLDGPGAVSGEVAEEMARQVRRMCGADFGVSITGIAGPGGGSADKPVGLVFVGLADGEGAVHHRFVFSGDRGMVRERSVRAGLDVLRRALERVLL